MMMYDDGYDSGKDRPVDEEAREAHVSRPWFAREIAAVALAMRRHLCTPRVRVPRPLTMTLSSRSTPDTTRRPSTTGPSVTYFGRTTLFASTTSTNLRACSAPIATSGTSSMSAGTAAASCTRPNMPGVNVRSAFSKTARARIVPDVRLTVLSKKVDPTDVPE